MGRGVCREVGLHGTYIDNFCPQPSDVAFDYRATHAKVPEGLMESNLKAKSAVCLLAAVTAGTGSVAVIDLRATDAWPSSSAAPPPH